MSRNKRSSRLTKFLQLPKLIDGIFEVSLRLQKFWWVQEIVRTRNGFALTDFLANQIKLRVVRTGPNTLSFLLFRAGRFIFLTGILLARFSITTSQHTVVTKTRNELQPSTTVYNHLKPSPKTSTTTQKQSTSILT